jgi:calcium-translocating P-type ATPase
VSLVDTEATSVAQPRGLTTTEAQELLRTVGSNTLPTARRTSVLRELFVRFFEPLNGALFGVGLATMFVLDNRLQGVSIIAISVLNAVVGLVLSRRADSASRSLGKLLIPTARVIRDGQPQVVSSAAVVPGDVLVLNSGDRVAADGELVSVRDLRLDEAMLTGESLSIAKSQNEMCWAGTLIASGSGLLLVTATGSTTKMATLVGMLDAVPPETPLQRHLGRLTSRLGLAALVIGTMASVVEFVRNPTADNRLGQAALVGVALALAAVPEGLPSAVTVSLAVSGLELAKRGAVVKSLTGLEALGSATVLCTDKTGTLTEGSLEVLVVEAQDKEELWRAVLRCNDAAGTGDELDQALIVSAPMGAPADPLVDVVPFAAERRSMTTVHAVSSGDHLVTVKGAPEVVLGRCADGTLTHDLTATAEMLAKQGHRVIAVAVAEVGSDDRRTLAGESGDHWTDSIPLRAVGLVSFGDPLRPTAVQAIELARNLGLRIVMVTGDHPHTATSIARSVGISTASVVTGAELSVLSRIEQSKKLSSATVIARVTPEAKLALIDALHDHGEIVAMTGDGVNDAPALRRADIGIAVGGEHATDVARDAAAVVLRDGDLGTVVAAIEHGRRVHRNIRMSMAYLLTGNLTEIMVIAAAVVAFPTLRTPLLPAQLLWINFITDTFPAFMLGIDNRPLADPEKPASDVLLSRMALQQMLVRSALLTVLILLSTVGVSSAGIQSQLVASLACLHLLLPYVVRAKRFAFEPGWSRNRLLLATIAISLAAQTLVFQLAPARRALGLSPIGIEGALRVLAACVVTTVLCWLVAIAFDARARHLHLSHSVHQPESKS